MDLLDGYRYAFRRGKIDEPAFRRGLGSLGITDERIDGWVFREGVKRKEVDKLGDLTEAKGAHGTTVVRRFKEGFIDDAGFNLEMSNLNYTPEEIEENKVYALLEYETDRVMDLLDGYRYAYRKRKIDEPEFRAGLLGLGMVEERVDGWTLREGVRRKSEE